MSRDEIDEIVSRAILRDPHDPAPIPGGYASAGIIEVSESNQKENR